MATTMRTSKGLLQVGRNRWALRPELATAIFPSASSASFVDRNVRSIYEDERSWAHCPDQSRRFSSLPSGSDHGNDFHNHLSKDSDDPFDTSAFPPTSEVVADDQEQDSVEGTMMRDRIRNLRNSILRNSKNASYESAHQALSQLNALAEESISSGRKLANVALHNNVLTAFANCGERRGLWKACELLKTMHERHQEYRNLFPPPNSSSYHCTLNACVNFSDANHAIVASRAEELIKEMEELSLRSDGDVHPTTFSYNYVIAAHAKLAPEKYGAANDAEDWLRYLSKLNTQGGPGPDSVSFNTVLKAWKDSPEDKAADRALELLQLMIKLYSEGHQQVTPCGISFGTVIHAFAKRKRPREAEDVLKMALGFFLDGDYLERVGPDTRVDLRVSFNTAIDGWAKCDESDSPERAEALLNDMQVLSQETKLVIAAPDAYSYTACMQAIARSGRPNAPEIVESRLYDMVEQHRRHTGAPLPTVATFDCAILTWFKSDKDNRAERMEALLNTLIELSQRCDDPKLLPPPRTVNKCLLTWLQSGRGSKNAMFLLSRMEAIGCVDMDSYLPLISFFLADKKNTNKNESLWAAAVVLEKLLAQIQHQKSIRWPTRPREIYKKILFGLLEVGTGSAGDRAYSLLEAIESSAHKGMKPSCDIYSVVIAALAKEYSPERTQKALNIFSHILSLHDDPKSKVKVDAHAFLSILTCLANTCSNTKDRKAAEKARSIFDTQLKMYLSSPNGDKKLRPNFRCYDKCVQAMARCTDIESLRLAVEMLKMFVDEFRQGKAPDLPSEVGLNTVMKFCSEEGSKEALGLADEVNSLKQQLLQEGHLISNLERKKKERSY